MRFVLLLLILAGCPDKPKRPTCETIPAKLTEAQVAEMSLHNAPDEAIAETRAQGKRIEPQITKACIEQKWDPELIKCIFDAAPIDVNPACLRAMPPEQLQTLEQLRGNANVPPPPPS